MAACQSGMALGKREGAFCWFEHSGLVVGLLPRGTDKNSVLGEWKVLEFDLRWRKTSRW
jgi:hypothetical protein